MRIKHNKENQPSKDSHSHEVAEMKTTIHSRLFNNRIFRVRRNSDVCSTSYAQKTSTRYDGNFQPIFIHKMQLVKNEMKLKINDSVSARSIRKINQEAVMAENSSNFETLKIEARRLEEESFYYTETMHKINEQGSSLKTRRKGQKSRKSNRLKIYKGRPEIEKLIKENKRRHQSRSKKSEQNAEKEMSLTGGFNYLNTIS